MSEVISINGVEYVPRNEANLGLAVDTDGLKYVIVRADRAGVFAGYLAEENGDTVILNNCRRIWYWKGAASISQLAVDGVAEPDECKFPTAVQRIRINGVIEIINATERSRKSIEGVAVWQE